MVSSAFFSPVFRSLIRRPLWLALNVTGLALGIGVFLVMAIYVQHERSFEVFPGSDRLWVVQEHNTGLGQPKDPHTRVMGGELDLLRADFPGLIGARYEASGGTVRDGARREDENVVLVDSDFFSLFDFRPLAGDPARALKDPGNIVITARAAKRWFGSKSVIGRTLSVSVGGKEGLYQVAAVVADSAPEQQVSGSVFLRLSRENIGSDYYDRWTKATVWTFLSFSSPAAAEAFAKQLPAFLERHAFPSGLVKEGEYSQSLLPLSAVRATFTGADPSILVTLLTVGGLTLAIAILNYVNLATARSSQRAREVAIRKVHGATRRQLIAQFMGESVAVSALATLTGVSVAEVMLPWVNALGGTDLIIPYSGGFLFSIIALALGIGILAGLYPAFLLSRHQPAQLLGASGAPGGGREGVRLRRALVVAQFAVAVSFAIATAVMLTQVAYLSRADVGFDRQGLLLAEATDFGALDRAQASRLLAALQTIPHVTGVTTNDVAPGWISPSEYTEITRSDDPWRAVAMQIVPTGNAYFEVYHSRRLAGRLFDAAHGMDDMALRNGISNGDNVVINRSALRYLGFRNADDAIGKIIGGGPLKDARIVGVIADMRFGDPHKALLPMLYTRAPLSFGSAYSLRFDGADPRMVSDAIEQRWKQLAPDISFQVQSASASMDDYYQQDRQRARLFAIGGVLAVVIGCIGLYGLAAFDTTRRTREIGIRKTLGASTSDILQLLLTGFLRPVMLANLIAWPIAYVGVRRWLAGFDDHVVLSPLFFFSASIAATLVASATVIGQSWRVARAEPARALRHG